MHPEVIKFIDDFEREAKRKRQFRNKLEKYEIIALEQVLGPALNYRFDGLKAEHPFIDSKGGQRFIDFVYIRGGLRIIMEIDGFTTHARDISYLEFDDHLDRQNDLVLSGWIILRFSANQVERHPLMCKDKIIRSIGHWWIFAYGGFSAEDPGPWTIRKKLLIELALRQGGAIRTIDISREFGVSHRTALNWLSRFVKEQIFIPIRPKSRVTGYRLAGYQP